MADFEMINDAFWLKYAEDHVTSAITTRDAAANKLDTYLGIVWPIYTAAFAVGSALNVINCQWYITLIITVPILLIPIARFLCVWVQLPILVEFHEQMPDSIEQNLYAKIIKEKSKRLSWATGFAITCGLSIGISLFTYKICSMNETNNYYMNISVNKEAKKLNIHGLFSKKTNVVITVIGLDSTSKDHFFVIPPLKSNDKGKIDTLLDYKFIEKQIKAFASFTDNNKNPINIASQ